MSSDNFLLIRRAGDRYAVTDESASAQCELEDGYRTTALWHPAPIDSPRIQWFDDLDAARDAAHGTYSEYGVTEELEGDATGDTFANRLGRLAADMGGSYPEHMRSNDHEACAATLHLGDITVTVASAGGDWERVCEYASWVAATTPDALRALAPAAPGTDPDDD